MMWIRGLGASTLLVYAVSLLGAAAAVSSHHPQTIAPPTRTPNATLPQPMIGFTLNVHHTQKLHLYHDAIDQMADLGVNTLQLLTPAFQQHGASQQIEVKQGPGFGPPREDLIALLNHARQRGMTTALMPAVLFTEPRGNEWRGKISPENWNTWWSSYNRMIDHFVDIAVEADVDIFCVGSELLTTERHTRRWHELIDRVRSQFDGKLIYSTNWDHFHTPTFWRRLDLIGVSGYWDMTTYADRKQPPTDEQLDARWRQIQATLFAFAADMDMPFVITEIGYPTLPWALKDPWNYVADSGVAPDPQPQARGYAAFCRAWSNRLSPDSHCAGVLFYNWDPYHQGGPGDTGYGIRGKPAYTIVADWLGRRITR
jgi:hypothetical protein